MPVVVDTTRCPCVTPCFPSKMCPYNVLLFNFDEPALPATLDPEGCGDCRGVCTNFCDPRALRFAPTMNDLRLLEAEMLGTMTAEQIQAERKRIKEQAETEAKKKELVIDVTAATFEQEVIQASLPVLVDFWAPWCGPCKAFAPVFSQAAQQYTGKVKFCKVNTDAEQSLAQALRIQSVPTLFVFYRGQALGAVPGAMSAAQLRSMIEQVLESVAPAAASAAAQKPAGTAPEAPLKAEHVQRGRKKP